MLVLIGSGRTNRQIGEALTISVPTVERHVHNVLGKLGCANRTEAAIIARAVLQSGTEDNDDEPVTESESPSRAAGADVLAGLEPYPGLRAYGQANADHFFGREEVIVRLVARLETAGALTIVGPSGSGKSSLVRAGLVPALQRSASPGSDEWTYLSMTPGAQPLAELAVQLALVSTSPALFVLRELEQDERALDIVARQIVAGRPDSARVVLVVDQFEELLTMCRERSHQQQFISLLRHAASVPNSPLVLVLAVRADFYGDCASFEGFANVLERGHVLLGPMSREELRRAIEGPVHAIGGEIEPALCDRILSDLDDAPGALPLLSHVLRETWNRREGVTMTVNGYLSTGGVRLAILHTAEAVYGALDEATQAMCRDLFLRLTEPGNGTEDTRRRVSLLEISPAGAGATAMRALVSRLADARLVTTGVDSIEVSHEALIREWPRLRDWLDEDRDGHRMLRHLTGSTQAWANLDRDKGELYRGARLAAASEWVARSRPGLNPLEKEFIEASEAHFANEQREAAARLRRLRVLAGGLAGLVVAAVIVSGIALVQRNRAGEERDRATAAVRQSEMERHRADAAVIEATLARLETEIPVLMKSDRSLAFALAEAAYRLQPGNRAGALLNVVLGDDHRYLGSIWQGEGMLAGFWVSPDGAYIATRASNGLIELHDAQTHVVLASAHGVPSGTATVGLDFVQNDLLVTWNRDPFTLEVEFLVLQVPSLNVVQHRVFTGVETWQASWQPFTADGTQMAVSMNQKLHLIGLRDGSDATPLSGNWTGGIAIDPSGRYIAAKPAGSTSQLGIFDAKSNELLRTVPQVGSAALAFSYFTADGGWLLVVNTAADGGRIDIWDPATGTLVGTAPSQPTPGGPHINLDSSMIAFRDSANPNQVALYDMPGLQPLGRIFSVLSSAFSAPYLDRDQVLYHRVVGGPLEYWDLTGKGLANVYSDAPGTGEAAFAPDGTWFVKQAPDGSWSRWSLPTLELNDRSTFTAGDSTLPGGGSGPLGPVISGDGRYFATGHSDCQRPNQSGCGSSVVVWDAKTGQRIGEPVHFQGAQTLRGSVLIAFHPDQPILAIAGPNNTIQIIRIEGTTLVAGKQFVAPNDGGPFVNAMAFLPSRGGEPERLFVSAGVWISAWDVEPDSAVSSGLLSVKADRRGFGISPTGAVVIAWSSGNLEFYHGEDFALDGKAPAPFRTVKGVIPAGARSTYAFTFSADERMLALRNLSDGTISAWTLDPVAKIGENFAPAGTGSMALSADGTSLVVSSDTTTVIWQLDAELWAEQVCLAAGRNLTEAEWAKYFPGREYVVICDRWPARPQIS